MPVKKNRRHHTKSQTVSSRSSTRAAGTVVADHLIFYPLLLLTLVVWVLYRQLQFHVWFDEIIGKAIFFGLPVWLYISVSGAREIPRSFSVAKFKSGLLLGLAIGGLFGFTATLLRLVTTQAGIQPVALFDSNLFWGEFLLSLVTAFWETVFFFAWIMVVIEEKYGYWPLAKQIALTALIFTIFHLPNTVLRFDGVQIIAQLSVLFMFAVGQGFLFAYRHNGYALVLSHAIWGMVLLVHLG